MKMLLYAAAKLQLLLFLKSSLSCWWSCEYVWFSTSPQQYVFKISLYFYDLNRDKKNKSFQKRVVVLISDLTDWNVTWIWADCDYTFAFSAFINDLSFRNSTQIISVNNVYRQVLSYATFMCVDCSQPGSYRSLHSWLEAEESGNGICWVCCTVAVFSLNSLKPIISVWNKIIFLYTHLQMPC